MIVAIHGNKPTAALHQSELRTMVQNADFARRVRRRTIHIQITHAIEIMSSNIEFNENKCKGDQLQPAEQRRHSCVPGAHASLLLMGVVLQTQSIAFLTSTDSLLALTSCVVSNINTSEGSALHTNYGRI